MIAKVLIGGILGMLLAVPISVLIGWWTAKRIEKIGQPRRDDALFRERRAALRLEGLSPNDIATALLVESPEELDRRVEELLARNEHFRRACEDARKGYQS